MRVLHISDLHAASTADLDQEEIVAAALKDIELRDREATIDLVVFSGDLAFDGTAEALARGRESLLEPLRALLPNRPAVIVPGNHDVNRSKISRIVEAGLQETLSSREAVAELVNSPVDLQQALGRLDEWSAFEAAWDEGSGMTSVEPLAKAATYILDGQSVGVACLNTAWRAQGGDEDKGRLILGEAQVSAALRAIDDQEVRIVVMHHPLEWLAEFDGTHVRAQLEGRGVFVLTGHEHNPDPTTEISTRGAALYSRAGCLYTSHLYSNSYTLLDLDVRRHVPHAIVRRWWPSRREFAEATDLQNSGQADLSWPHRTAALPAQRAALPDVILPLVEIAQEQSVLTDQAVALEHMTVSDLLVSPRFWRVPYKDLVEPRSRAARRQQAIEPLDQLDNNRVLIISGPHFSGVTGALLWLLERHFRLRGTRVPAYVRIDPRMSLGRLNDAVKLGLTQAGESGDSSAPVLLAIDDAAPSDSRALGRLVRFLQDHPNVTLLLGTHDDAHAPIAETLRDRSIRYERAFLGPMGRRELRQLVRRIAGSESSGVVQRVLETIHSQRLPRNPLNIAALVFVLTREPDLSTINESGLLQSFVNVLLENPTGVDPEGLSMDYRRREHLLERFAELLVRSNRSRLLRGEIEQFVLDYFREVGWRAGSAGHLVDSLIRRRVLVEDDVGVGFRYLALLHLFAAKWMLEDKEFAEYILADPIGFGEIIRHSAGLRRNDRELLVTIAALAERTLSGVTDVTVRQFDLMRDERGWSQVKDLEDVRALLEPPPAPPTEEQLDEIYEEVADDPVDEAQAEVVPARREALTPIEGIELASRLLAAILQSSELVPDVALKAEVLETVIVGWSMGTVILAVREDERGMLRELFEGVLEVDDPDEKRSLAAHISRLLVVFVMTVRLYLAAGSTQLQAVVERVLDDEPFMADTAPALFATMLHAMLELPRWPDRLRALHQGHGKHPVVKEIVRAWALRQYHTRELRRRDEAQIEELLVDLLTPERRAASSVAERAAQRSEILEEVRRSRLEERFARGASADNLDEDLDPVVDVEVEEDRAE